MKNLTKDFFNMLDFIPTLLKYFALSPENRVTCPGLTEDVTITYYQDDDGHFHKIVALDWGKEDPTYEPMDFTLTSDIELGTLRIIINNLPHLPATRQDCGFKNMYEQVRALSTAYTCLGGF